MDYSSSLLDYNFDLTSAQIQAIKSKVEASLKDKFTRENLSLCFSCMDLTSLSVVDSQESITEFATKVAVLKNNFKDVPSPASICVYPVFVDVVGLALGNSSVAITGVAAGFPSSQTFLEVKMLETAMVLESGADEIDVVMSVGEFLQGDYNAMANELEMLKDEVGDDVTLKVILETGELKSTQDIYNASILSMCAGADFIKTSTGKTPVSATPEAVIVMCHAVKDYYEKTGIKVGVKVAGGVKTSNDALLYLSIMEEILGEDWLSPSLFRIGASSLANSLLSDISGSEVSYF